MVRFTQAVRDMAATAVCVSMLAACQSDKPAVLEPDGATNLVSVFSKRQANRCEKYRLVDGSFSWDEARMDAVDEQFGTLASVSSVEEQACISELLYARWVDPKDDVGLKQYWLNGTEQREMEWRWFGVKKNGVFWRDGASLGYSNWGTSQPSGDGDCLTTTVDLVSYAWNDASCVDDNGGVVIGYVLRIP